MRLIQTLRNSKGFSTIELVVVTGIVGAMMTMAVPSYQGFVAKSRQGEGKAALARVFTSQQSFFQEWGWYTLCLKQAGFQADSSRFYMVGFLNANGTGSAQQGFFSNNAVTDHCDLSVEALHELGHNDATWNWNKAVNTNASSEYTGAAYQTWESSASGPAGFLALAAGSVSEARSLDVWTIDAQRVILNKASGL